MSSGLPAGWAVPSIQDVCSAVSKRGPSRDRATFKYIDLGAIDNRSKTIAEPSELQVEGAPSRAKQIVKKGDVVFSNVRVYLENIALVPDELDGEVASTAFSVLRPNVGIEPRYLHHFVTSKPFIQSVSALQRGNSPPSVQDGDVKSQRIPLAPTSEQKRIVSKIDELFSRIDEGERALEWVSKLVERYRQSVLKAAVTGELTRDWREARKAAGEPIESGEALLTRILAARREAWEKAELAKMQVKDIEPANDTWKNKYKEPPRTDTSDLPKLPSGWVWASLAQLSWASSYGTSQKCDAAASGIAVLRIPNIRGGAVNYEDIKHATADLELEEGDALSAGDLLVIRTNGSESLIGVGATLRDDAPVPCYFASYLIRFRLVLPSTLSEWINFCWQSHVVRQFIHEHKATSAGQYNVSQSSLMELRLPIPPPNEIREVVDCLKRSFSKSENATGSVNVQLRHTTALRQGVLKSAFAGLLVTQCAADEPASALLKRISEERTLTNIAAPKRARKKTSE